jgi:vacuolar protein sorting-associated protein IST1
MQLQRNKQTNLVKIHKREIAGLLDRGKDESARIKVEHVIREDFYMEAVEILELFCELLLARVPQISSSKDLPVELAESVSTLVYASYRIDVKELEEVRKDLVLKFGEIVAVNAQQNSDGSVNPRVINKLSTAPPEQFLVLQYLREIAKEFKIDWQGGDWQADLALGLPLPPGAGPGPMGGGGGSGGGGAGGRPGMVMQPMDPRMQMLQHPAYGAPAAPPAAPVMGEYGVMPSLPVHKGEYGMPDLPPQEYAGRYQSGTSVAATPLPPPPLQGISPPPPYGDSAQRYTPPPPPPADLAPAAHYAQGPPPAGGDAGGLPDFDELTRRFEALKKR